MADQQLEALTEITSLAAGDEFLVNDVSDTTDDANGSPKKVLASSLGVLINGGAQAAAFTADPNHHYLLDNESGVTDRNRLMTLPTTGLVVGDEISWEMSVQNATNDGTAHFPVAPHWCWEIEDAGNLINGAAYTPITGTAGFGGNKWSYWINGECGRVRWNGTTWIMVNPGGRAAQRIGHSGAAPTTDNTTVAMDLSALTQRIDNAGRRDTTNDRYYTKRAGDYRMIATVRKVDLDGTATPRMLVAWRINESTQSPVASASIEIAGEEVTPSLPMFRALVAGEYSYAVNNSGPGTVDTADCEIISEETL